MRVCADDAQKVLNMLNSIHTDIEIEGIVNQSDSEHQGTINTELDIDISQISNLSHTPNIEDVATDIDAEIMDNIFGSARNNSNGRHEGYNRFEILKALEREDQIQQETIQTITGADPRTVDNWHEDFRKAGLTYNEEGSEALTTEGEIFVEESYRFLDDVSLDADENPPAEYMGNIFSSLSRKYKDQGDKMCGFLLMAETDKSLTDIAGDVNTSRRTAYNWSNEWFGDEESDEIPLFRGEPGERQLTQAGRALYGMIGNQYQRIDTTSQMKAELIDQLDDQMEAGDTCPFIPGNRDMVAQYTDSELVDRYMMRE